MILSRSPYYVIRLAQGLSLARGIIRLNIWSGNEANPPATFQYQQEKRAITNDNLEFEISEVIKSYFTDDTNALWVQYSTLLYESGSSTPVSPTPPETIVLALKGYGLFEYGMNSSIDQSLNAIPMYQVHKGGSLNIGLIANSTYYNNILITYDNGTTQAVNLATNISSAESTVKVVSISLSETNFGGLIQYRKNTTVLHSRRIELLEGCNDGIVLSYTDKNGLPQQFAFDGKIDERVDITSNIVPTGTLTRTVDAFSSYDHKKFNEARLNINGKRNFTLNTGWVSADFKYTLEQILMSETATINDIKVFPVDTDVTYQNDEPDSLINYEITFQASNPIINNV